MSPADRAPTGVGPRVAVLADDLIWSTRLVEGVRAGGGDPVAVRGLPAFEDALGSSAGVIVDLTARAYDGVAALRAALAVGVPSIAVAQHDDAPLRARARAAGADRVFAYRAMFQHGPAALAAWVASIGPGRPPE